MSTRTTPTTRSPPPLPAPTGTAGDAARRQGARQETADATTAELARANDALRAVTDALAQARGLDEIVPTVLEIAARTFGVATAAFYEHQADTVYLRYWLHEGGVLRPAELLALDPIGRHAVPRRLAEGFTVPAAYLGGTTPSARTRAVVIDHAAGTVEPEFDAWTRAHGWALELNVPCVVGGSARGALVLHRSAATYTPAEVALAEALAKQLALAMEADRLARAVRDRAVEGAVARERAAAAETRGAELQQANDAMRRSVARAGAALDLDALLEAFLLEAMAVAGASGGAVDLWDGDRYLGPRCVAQDGAIVPRAAWEGEPMFRKGPGLLARNPGGLRDAILTGGLGVATVEDCDAWWPAAAAYHRTRGHRVVWNLPLRARGAVVASLGLAFRGAGPADSATRATLEALAQQAALALELTRLGDVAREAAVAGEREQAANKRAAELARANAALQRTVAGLGEVEDLAEFYHVVLREMSTLLDASSAALMLYEPVARTFRMTHALVGGAPEPLARSPHDRVWSLDDPVIAGAWAAIQAADPVLLAELDGPYVHPETRPWHHARGDRSAFFLPIRRGAETLGFAAFGLARGDEPAVPTRDLAVTLAQQLALALELTRLGDAAREAAVAREREAAAARRAEGLAAANAVLAGVNARMAGETRLDALLGHVLAEACALLGVQDGCVGLLDHDGHLRFVATFYDGRPSTTLPGHPFGAGEPIPLTEFAWPDLVAAGGRPITTTVPGFVAYDARIVTWHQARGHTGMLSQAIMLGDRPVGLLGLAFRNGRAFTDDETEFLRALGQQAALAIQLTRLADAAREAAVAREREQAAEARAAELRKVNDALRGSVDALTAADTVEGILAVFLRETLRATGASAGAVLTRAGDTTQFDVAVIAADGGAVEGAPAGASLLADEIRRVSRADRQGYFAALASGAVRWRAVDDPLAADLPLVTAHHLAAGRRIVWDVPYAVAGRVHGYLSVVFTHDDPPSQVAVEAAQALATQAGLALELTRLAAAARAEAAQAAVLEERTRIARELHDTLAQCFTGIVMQLQAAAELAERAPAVTRACLTRAEDLARVGLRQAREAVAALGPDAAEARALGPALRALVERASAGTAQPAVVAVRGRERPLPADLARHVVRVCQEALGNAQRYSGARRIDVTLAFRRASLVLCVADDGAGFDVGRASDAGSGLAGMRRRAERLGGRLDVRSAAGTGTRVCLDVPLPAKVPLPAAPDADRGAPSPPPATAPGAPARRRR